MVYNDFVSKKDFKDIMSRAPEGVRPEIILRGLVGKGKVVEGYNEDQFPRDRLRETSVGAWKSIGGFFPQAIGGMSTAISKADPLKSMSKQKGVEYKPDIISKGLESIGVGLDKFGKKNVENVTQFAGSRGIRQDTGFAKGGKIGGDIGQSLLPGGLFTAGPKWGGLAALKSMSGKEAIKKVGQYVGGRAAIGAGEETLYNLGTEGTVKREGGTPDLVLGIAAEVLLPAGFDEVSNLYKFRKLKGDKFISGIERDLKAGKITEEEAVTNILEESQKRRDIPGISNELINEATKDPDLLRKYFENVKQSNKTVDAPGALESAVKEGQKAVDMIRKEMNNIGSELGNFKNRIAGFKLTEGQISQLKGDFVDALDGFNARLDETGKIVRKEGEVGLGTPNSDLKILQDIYDQGVQKVSSMKSFYDYLDALRSRVKYEGRIGGPGSDAIEELSQGLAADARKVGRQNLEPADKKLFDEYTELSQFMTDFNKAAGTEAKLGLLLRRATSAKGFEQEKIIRYIYERTGIDLKRHAMFSRAAVEMLAKGDSQKTLLQGAIKHAGVEAGNILFDAAVGNYGNALMKTVKRLRPKKDPAKVLLRIANKYNPGKSYEQALEIVNGLKEAGYKGVGPVPDIIIKPDGVRERAVTPPSPLMDETPGVTRTTNDPAQVRGTPGESFSKASPAKSADLSEEAKKYKTADEFVESKVRKGLEYDHRTRYPKVRGGRTKKKILRELKKTKSFGKDQSYYSSISKFNSPDDLANNIYYHGTARGPRELKPSIAISRFDEVSGGGGYGEKYWGISLSKDRNMASNFTSNADSGRVYPVVLKKGAKVKEMPNISDAVEIDEHIEKLWDEGVDAVKIGDWNNPSSEMEIVILNPRAISVGPGEGFRVYQKPKMPSFSKEEIIDLYNSSAKKYKEVADESYKRHSKSFKEKYGRMPTRYTEKEARIVKEFEEKQQLRKIREEANQGANPKMGLEQAKKIVGGEELPKETAQFLKKSKGLSADDIMKQYPDINLKRDLVVKDIHGKKVELDEGEALTPYVLKGNKVLLQDGETYVVSAGKWDTIKNNSVLDEAKPFAPELKDTKETVKGANNSIDYDNKYAIKEVTKIAEQNQGNIDNAFLITLENDGDAYRALMKKFPELEGKDDWAEIVAKEVTGGFGNATDTKYAQYTLPGGENYREILVQAPKGKPNLKGFKVTKLDYDTPKPYRAESPNSTSHWATRAEADKALENYIKIYGDIQLENNAYKSSHRDEPNIITHLRMNDRTYKGKKVAFLEEIQSDWAGEGRRKGFIDKKIPFPEESELTIEKIAGHRTRITHPEGGLLGVGNTKGEAMERARETWDVSSVNGNGGIIGHPLLKDRQELAVKRALKEAADTDAKYFSWINGEQTSNRYSLSTHLKSVIWEKSPYIKGNTDINLSPIDGNMDIAFHINKDGKILDGGQNVGDGWKGKMLDEVVGKGLADKIMGKEKGTLEGEGLRFGGERAFNLYDKQVRNIIKKLTGKKAEPIDLGLPSGKKAKGWSFSAKDGSEVFATPKTIKDLKIGDGISEGVDNWIAVEKMGDKLRIVPEEDFFNILDEKINHPDMGKYDKVIDISVKEVKQQAIELTPDIIAKIKGLSPLTKKPSGRKPFAVGLEQAKSLFTKKK